MGYLRYDLTDGRLGQTRQPSSGRINELSQSTELAAQVEQDEMVPGRVIDLPGWPSLWAARALALEPEQLAASPFSQPAGTSFSLACAAD